MSTQVGAVERHLVRSRRDINMIMWVGVDKLITNRRPQRAAKYLHHFPLRLNFDPNGARSKYIECGSNRKDNREGSGTLHDDSIWSKIPSVSRPLRHFGIV